MSNNKLQLFIKIGITTTAAIGTIILALFIIRQITDPVFKIRFEDFIRSAGPLGWLVIMLLQFCQIVIAPIPAEPVQIIAGVLYGPWGGLLLMTLGSIPASILVWKIAGKYGKPMLYQVFGEKRINKLPFMNQAGEIEWIAVIIFLLPVVPKDLFSYLCGLTSMKYSRYLMISTLARIPATLLYTMMGDSLKDGQWGLVIITVLAVLVIFFGVKYKNRKTDKKSRVLLSEGSSLTARETLTALHGSGCQVDVLSSSSLSITSFSSWKKRTICINNLNKEPKNYLQQVTRLLESGAYITVLPTHETAWLFAEARQYLPEHEKIMVSAAAAFRRVQGKIAFAVVAGEAGLPIPPWQLLGETVRLRCPCWLKADYGTAGRSVFKINRPVDIARGIEALAIPADQLMLQEHISGQYGQVQAVFNHGQMVAVHTTMQQGTGAGGSAAARISVDFPETREHIDRLGRCLDWHGGITLDFIYKDETPYYIECNPRMIEPANAALAGVNFPQILIHLSAGQDISGLTAGRPGIKTHSTMALLLGAAEQTLSRRAIIKVLLQCLTKTGPRADSTEVLTPVWQDPLSLVPLLAVLSRLLLNPHNVKSIAGSAVKNYCVWPETINRLNADN